jgi:dephospho-CoA kinase
MQVTGSERRLIVGLTGHIGAGKTSVGKYLKDKHGFGYVRYSQVISDWREEDPNAKARLRVVGWEVMSGGQQAELNQRLIARIDSSHSCAVDGLRHPVDVESLTGAFPGKLRLVYLDSPAQTRWQRLLRTYPTFEQFKQADTALVEQHIDSLRDKAFAVLENNRSLQDLYVGVDALLKRMFQGEPV